MYKSFFYSAYFKTLLSFNRAWDAVDMLRCMIEIAEKYSSVTVKDVCIMRNVPCDPESGSFAWHLKDLIGVEVSYDTSLQKWIIPLKEPEKENKEAMDMIDMKKIRDCIAYSNTTDMDGDNAMNTISTTAISTSTTAIARVPHSGLTVRSSIFDELVASADHLHQKLKKKTDSDKYTPDYILYNDPATIVFWKDGTKTVVKRAKGEPHNAYNAFCAALAKKIFENNSRVNAIVKGTVIESKRSKKLSPEEEFMRKYNELRAQGYLQKDIAERMGIALSTLRHKVAKFCDSFRKEEKKND